MSVLVCVAELDLVLRNGDKCVLDMISLSMMNTEPQTGRDELQPIRIPASYMDIRAGIIHDKTTAEREGFPGVAQRAADLLEQLERAEAEARTKGTYHFDLVFTFPPHLNERG